MSNWFINFRYQKQSPLRLFVFPYAGGNASIFHPWTQTLTSHIDLIALQSPGKGIRLTETPIDKIEQLVEQIFPHILPYLDTPYAFYGHSNGALIAYELLHYLRQHAPSQFTSCQRIIISAKKAPHISYDKKMAITHLPDDQFIARLRDFNGTPEEVLANKELMSLHLPMLRADFSISEHYEYQQRSALTTNISSFYGVNDQHVPVDSILAWQQHFQPSMATFAFPGDHFFIHQYQTQVINKINQLFEHY